MPKPTECQQEASSISGELDRLRLRAERMAERYGDGAFARLAAAIAAAQAIAQDRA